MGALLRKVSTITEKGQTTIPKSVREALGVDFGGQIAFFVDEDRRVIVERVDEDADDPVIDGFLSFLESDMARNPQRTIFDIPLALRDRIAGLTEGCEVDPDESIEGDVAL